MVAYDFETTRIEDGTPRPLYLTAFGVDMYFEQEIKNTRSLHAMDHLQQTLVTHFLTEDRLGTKFVAWNGNRFDAYFIAAALIRNSSYRLRPYLTKSKALRGLRVTLAEDGDNPRAKGWEFVDGIAMLGLAGTSLDKFLANFAPEHKKLKGTIDFEGGEQFNPAEKTHRDYAMRDSEGLYHGMTRAQQIMLDTFNEPLSLTMGAVCIKIFAAHIPKETSIKPLDYENERIVREYVMRGGYCYCVRRYDGPVWKYDLNQAYAAAMRETDMPCGDIITGKGDPRLYCISYLIEISANLSTNTIPFYHRAMVNGRIKSCFSIKEIPRTWITSTEHRQLVREGWNIECHQFIAWASSFNMREFVDKLETLRINAEGGPSGPIGTMVKATGNHSFGKTAEQIEPIEYVLAMECPPDCLPYYADGPEPLEHVFYKFDENQRPKDYHKPQLASFITAHCRMVLRQAILKRPDSWLYADTDCIVFDSDVTALLDIHPKRYGAWKIEESGTHYKIIAKKVYTEVGGEKPKRSAKGMNVRKLTDEQFADWFDGNEPVQDQVQINNFLALLDGTEMYRTQTRRGTHIEVNK
jgi:hypothetical protein